MSLIWDSQRNQHTSGSEHWLLEATVENVCVCFHICTHANNYSQHKTVVAEWLTQGCSWFVLSLGFKPYLCIFFFFFFKSLNLGIWNAWLLLHDTIVVWFFQYCYKWIILIPMIPKRLCIVLVPWSMRFGHYKLDHVLAVSLTESRKSVHTVHTVLEKSLLVILRQH